MKRRVKLSWPVTLILSAAAVLLVACGGGPSDSVLATGLSNLAEATTRGIDNGQRGLDPGQLAPDFTLQFQDGKKMKLSDWQGQPVVLNFWATWCAPCKEEMPEFVKAHAAYQDDGLIVLGVNAGETAEQAARFMQQYGMAFPVTLDERSELQQLYNVRGLPTTVFIDRDGRIVSRWAGMLNGAMLEERLAQIR